MPPVFGSKPVMELVEVFFTVTVTVWLESPVIFALVNSNYCGPASC